MNTTPKTETAQSPKVTTPQKPSGDSAPQKPPVDPAIAKRKKWSRLVVILAVIAIAGGAGFYTWQKLHPKNAGLASGNGRIEATEIDVATKLAGRVEKIMVAEGDFVTAGQVLAQMQVDTLEAQRDEARAQHQKALHAVANAKAQAALQESNKAAAEAVVVQREAELDAAHRRFVRTEKLTGEKVTTPQQLDDDRATQHATEAAVRAAQSQVAAADSAIEAAKAEVVGAESAVEAAQATIARIEADLRDSALKSPRDGRVQYKVAQEREVLPAGGKVLNMIDLADVYMTFFCRRKRRAKLRWGPK